MAYMLKKASCFSCSDFFQNRLENQKRDKINPGMVAKNTQKKISIPQIFLNITAQHSEASFLKP
jgi:hypothetical protein